MNRPNILVLMTDQHSAKLLGCAGNPDVRTPNLDRLAATGTRFERAYVTFPLCVPSRASLLTGRYPHQLGIQSNHPDAAQPGRSRHSLGHLLAAAGYDCRYAGKWHATHPEVTPADGFTSLHPFGDTGLVQACAAWLRTRDGADRPFLLVASFDDPHTICEYARNQPMPYGNVDPAPVGEAPNLPPNFGHQPYEAQALRVEQRAGEHTYGTGDYGPDEWRQYRHTYARLVERADAMVGGILDALDASGRAGETVVVFTSDHGDGDAAHAWNQKTALYEEIVRVPLIARWPGRGTPGTVHDAPVSSGLDLLPTLCEVAGITAPADLPGRSLVPALDGRAEPDRTIVVETAFERDGRLSTQGRALIRGRHKYAVYSWGRHREQLHDLSADPGEVTNLAVATRHHELLETCREQLLEWCLANGDGTFLRRLVLARDTDPAQRAATFSVPY